MTDPTARPDDEAWLAEPPRRSRVRRLLVALLLASCVFYAGVAVQQRWGSSSAAFPAGGGMAAMGEMGEMREGGPPDTSSDAASTSAQETPAVIGTVTATDGTTWTVTDLGGTAHQVVVTADLRVGAGTTVSVAGTTDAQGLVTATSVTVR